MEFAHDLTNDFPTLVSVLLEGPHITKKRPSPKEPEGLNCENTSHNPHLQLICYVLPTYY